MVETRENPKWFMWLYVLYTGVSTLTVGCFSLEKCLVDVVSDLSTVQAFTVAGVNECRSEMSRVPLFSSVLLGKGGWLWLCAPAPVCWLWEGASLSLASSFSALGGDCRGKLHQDLPLLSWTS